MTTNLQKMKKLKIQTDQDSHSRSINPHKDTVDKPIILGKRRCIVKV